MNPRCSRGRLLFGHMTQDKPQVLVASIHRRMGMWARRVSFPAYDR